MSEKTTYSISELEQISGIPADTIRTWERRYGLLCPVRDAGNTRCYARDVVGYLRHLAVLLKQGYRISALAAKSREEIEALVQELHPPHPDDLTEAICHALREYQSERVERLIDCYFKKEGFDNALQAHFIPFIEQTGILLLSNVLKPVQTQIFCNVLRQKLFVAIEAQEIPKNAETWLLLHGRTDADAVHLDILHYLLRRKNRHVLRLDISGRDDISDLLDSIKPSGCCIVADGGYRDGQLQQLINSVVRAQGNTLVFTPGKTLDFVNNAQIPAFPVIHGLSDAFRYL